MLEKVKTIWNKIKAWFIKVWNNLMKFFKKQEEIPVEVKPMVEEPVKSSQTKKSK
jgi:hypothetical protein